MSVQRCEYCGDPIPSGSECDECREHWARMAEMVRHLSLASSIEASVRERAQRMKEAEA